jgi:hypothetical protein
MPPLEPWKERLAKMIHDPGRTEQSKVLSDWNRQVMASDKCSYCINGQPVSDVRKGKPFETVADLKTFFKENLFHLAPKAEQEALAENALSTFYQAGIPHATSAAVQELQSQQFKIGSPVSTIKFESTAKGVSITEENQYREWYDGSKNYQKHSTTGTSKPYYAKVESTFQVTSTDIQLSNFTVDCPSRHLAEFFGKPRSMREGITSMAKKLFGGNASKMQTAATPEGSMDKPIPLKIKGPG